MGYAEIVRVTPDQLDLCDQCGQQGLKTSGEMITDSYSQDILWFCFNCVQSQNQLRKKLNA
jgi:hypothetical protein